MMKANVSFPVNPATILQRRYIAALLLVGMLTLGTQWLIQGNLASQLADSKVINVAGRQRMLSQRLCKAAYKDLYAADSESAKAAIAELKLVRKRWTEGHQALLEGNPKLGIPRTENAEIRVLLTQAQVYQNAMLEATAFVDAPINRSLEKARRDDLRFLLSNEPLFLDRMEKVVSAYEKAAQKKVADGRRGEIAFALVTLLLLIAEAFFVFRPATRTSSTTSTPHSPMPKRLASRPKMRSASSPNSSPTRAMRSAHRSMASLVRRPSCSGKNCRRAFAPKCRPSQTRPTASWPC